MPKKKKSTNKSEKEKPLLTVQGVLRLEKCFVTAQNADAEVIKVQEDGDKVKEIRLVPGDSEHEQVKYKLGYELGPANPFPTNEPEKEIYEAQKKVEEKQEAFDKLKEQSEAEKKEREIKFRKENLIPESELQPPGEEPESELKEIQTDPKELDPDDPENYILPKEMMESSHEVPKMKPLPDEQEFGKEMALSVALEMEENRRKRKHEEPTEPEKEPEEDNFVYSLDELTRIKSLDQEVAEQGPGISAKEMVKNNEDYKEDGKKLLEAYWQFVNENPHDFTGWTYLLQHVENIDILDEIRGAYNKFLPLYPYCFAYWIRYSDIEKKHEHWEQSFKVLERSLEAMPMSVDLRIAFLELYHKLYKNHENFGKRFREHCESAVMTVGLDFNSDQLWER